MSALRRQATPAVASGPALEARVSNPDPAALTVTIDSFDGDAPARHAWEVAAWPRTPGATPARGDRCLVVMSETGRPWVVVGDWSGPPEPPVWRRPDFIAAWSDWNNGAIPAGYAKSRDGWVSFRGLVVFSSDRLPVPPSPAAPPAPYSQMLASPLPEGFRPATSRSFVSSVNGLAGRIQVYSDGRIMNCEVPAGAPADAWWQLDGIGYWAER